MKMRSDSISPVEAVQNSALCAYMLWSFGRGYQEKEQAIAPFHLHFILLPLVLHRPTLDKISGTWPTSGLGKFVEKFAHQREELLAINERARAMRRLTLEAISTGLASGLLRIDYETSLVEAQEVRLRQPSDRVRPLAAGARKVGQWMSRIPSASIFSLLQVRP